MRHLHVPARADAAAIIVAAVGDELGVAHPDEGLSAAELATVAGGPAIYLFAHVASRWRMTGTPSGKRLAAAFGCCAAGAMGAVLPAVATAALVLAMLVTLIAAERLAGIRRERRGELSPLERLEASAAARGTL